MTSSRIEELFPGRFPGMPRKVEIEKKSDSPGMAAGGACGRRQPSAVTVSHVDIKHYAEFLRGPHQNPCKDSKQPEAVTADGALGVGNHKRFNHPSMGGPSQWSILPQVTPSPTASPLLSGIFFCGWVCDFPFL